MDTAGISWGLYANSGQMTSDTYVFNSSMSIGDSVSISVGLGFVSAGGAVGFGLQNSSHINLFETYYIGSDATDAWKINDAEGQESITGVDTGFVESTWQVNHHFLTFEFTLLAVDRYSLTVNGDAITNANLNLVASDIDRIRVFNFNAGGGSDRNQYFNSLTLIPEPTSCAVIFGALILIGVMARRRQ